MPLPQNPLSGANRQPNVPQQRNTSVFGTGPDYDEEWDAPLAPQQSQNAQSWETNDSEDEDWNAPPSEPSAPQPQQPTSSVFAEDDEDELMQHHEQNTPNTSAASEFSEEVQNAAELLMEAIVSDDSTEVILNGPNEVMMKRDGVRYTIPDIQFGDKDTYHRVINEYILPYTDTKDRVSDSSHLVEGQLEIGLGPNEAPLLARVHIVAPPVVRHAKVTIAKKSRYALTLDDIQESGSMTRGMSEFLKALAQGRACVIFSGLSGAGKTTMLEATSHYFDQNDRVIVVEDTPELRLPVADTVYMTASSNRPGGNPEEKVTLEWLVRATNRMRPDRIIVGEVRGPEMSEFLVAANSGADGSMLTIHADNPRRCLDKILGLVMRSEGAKNENSINRDIANTVHVIVQLALIDGRHRVTHIEEISNVVNQQTGNIATSPLFEFDRSHQRHVARSRPSENLTDYLAQRGVQMNPAWFI